MAGKAKAPPSGLIVFLTWNAAPRREPTSTRKPVCKRSLQRSRCARSCSRGSLERQGGGGWGSPCVVKYLRALNVDNATLPLRWASPERIALYCQVSVTEAPGNLTRTNFHQRWRLDTQSLQQYCSEVVSKIGPSRLTFIPTFHHLIRRCNLCLHHPLHILLALHPFQLSPQTSCLTLGKCKRRLRETAP